MCSYIPTYRAGSENDTLLPMTMTCDRLKFWSGPAWRSKVIIRKPWRRKNKKNFLDKTIRHSRREDGMPNERVVVSQDWSNLIIEGGFS